MKNIILSISFLLALSSCYKEDEVIPDLIAESKGKVAQIAVFWAGTNSASKVTTITVDAGTTVPCNVEYTSEIAVTDIKLFALNGTTPLEIIPASAAKWDAKLRNYVVIFNVKAPVAKAARLQVQAEAATDNGLASIRRTITINTRP
jgi:hypothetical protein